MESEKIITITTGNIGIISFLFDEKRLTETNQRIANEQSLFYEASAIGKVICFELLSQIKTYRRLMYQMCKCVYYTVVVCTCVFSIDLTVRSIHFYGRLALRTSIHCMQYKKKHREYSMIQNKMVKRIFYSLESSFFSPSCIHEGNRA